MYFKSLKVYLKKLKYHLSVLKERHFLNTFKYTFKKALNNVKLKVYFKIYFFRNILQKNAYFDVLTNIQKHM